ncbi:unnamed protein product [Kuraishia capsulata CBS 1993]|uniref:CRA domain-containing protein n=1 Tax=Kuraishia capsulata CBS 1993 TaxID=1382522 RepID=W6MT21_9ASCO|nr:uncharacterized protein KUCA_T00005873001 [Kuraishia capsulata CBS 1993]CDK29879.1 unnamed protein product [Kuraishia capsulata CBS 1993]
MISESTKSSQKEQLILQAAEYGRYLQEQYEHNESLVSYLHDISSLLAFENPKDSSHWYLLDSVQKQKVLNDLNKALLARLGKPTDSVFKQIIQHIKLALSLMVEPHRQQSSFINVEEDFLDI